MKLHFRVKSTITFNQVNLLKYPATIGSFRVKSPNFIKFYARPTQILTKLDKNSSRPILWTNKKFQISRESPSWYFGPLKSGGVWTFFRRQTTKQVFCQLWSPILSQVYMIGGSKLQGLFSFLSWIRKTTNHWAVIKTGSSVGE